MNLNSPGLLHSVIEAAPVPLWLIEPDGSVALVNEAAATVLGYPQRRGLIGRSSHQTLHPRRADGSPYPGHSCPIVNAVGSVQRSHTEEFIDRRGRTVPVRWRLRELPDSQFKLLSFTPRAAQPQQLLGPTSGGKVTFDQIRSYIESHCADPALDPQQLAERAGVSLRTLQSVFSAHDTSPAVEIRRARLLYGHGLLQEGRGVTETALACGFRDVSTFRRAYRQAFRRPPSTTKADPGSGGRQ